MKLSGEHLRWVEGKLANGAVYVMAVLFAVLILSALPVRADTVDDACTKGTWANCGAAAKQWLDKNASPTPQQLVRVANLWAEAYGKQFDQLRAAHRIEKSTPDSEKIFEAVKSKLDPIDIAKDKAVDSIVKKLLPKAAVVLKWASTPLGVALQAFFNSSEIATDYDELRLMNEDLQSRFMEKLGPSLKPNWKDLLNSATQQAAPQLVAP